MLDTNSTCICLLRAVHSAKNCLPASSCVFLRHLGLSLRLPSSSLDLPAVCILHSEFFTSPCSTPSVGAAAPPPGCFLWFWPSMRFFHRWLAIFWTVSAPEQSLVAAASSWLWGCC